MQVSEAIEALEVCPPCRTRQVLHYASLKQTSPIEPASNWEKKNLPSPDAQMARAPLAAVGIGYSPIIFPRESMRPILLAAFSVNHSSPSFDTQTPRKDAFGVGTRNSMI